MRTRGTLIGLAAILFLALGPASTSALNRPLVKPLPPPLGFTLKTSNGYSMFVFGVQAGEGRPSAAGIYVTDKDGGAGYSVPAAVTETSIQADFGALGEIAVTFHPSGQARTVHPACAKKRSVSFDSGYYEGVIDFHGEERYTDVEASRARGDLGFLLNVICPGMSGESGSSFLPGAELNVGACGPQPGPHLMVVKNRPKAPAHFEASFSEKRDGVSILRFTHPIFAARTFEYDPRVQTATVHPPLPFLGAARFHRAAKPRNRWTGNLTVDLPGRSGVKLTGGALRAGLAHAEWDWRPALNQRRGADAP